MKRLFLLMFMGLVLLVMTALLGMYFLHQNNLNKPENNYQEITKVNLKNYDVSEESSVVKTNSSEISNAESSSQPIFSLIYPVEGDIGLGYSPDTLIYSRTLKEWIIHNGIDIQSPRGAPVKASEAGTVENIQETTDKGIEITISHDNGYKTIYSNLSSKDMVKIGQKVEKFQVISGIGNTSSFEYYEPDHLHFEIIKDGKYINPLDVLT